MSNYCPGTGKTSAKLVIVGEFPDKHANEQRVPFVGVVGQDVNRFLEEGGSTRSQCWLTNVVKKQPPFNNLSRLDEIHIDLTQAKIELWEELDSLKEKNCILCLGEQALQAITGKSGIMHWRGSILTALDGKTKAVATYHPARLYKENEQSGLAQVAYQWKYIIGFDFARAIKQSKESYLDLPNRALTVIRSSNELRRYLNDNIGKGPISVDIEAINCVPVCIGISFVNNEAVSVPLFERFGNFRVEGIGASELVYMWRDLQEALFVNEGVIGQNFKYDEDKIYRLGFRTRKLYGDTLLLGHTLNPEYPSKKLEFWTSLYTEEPYYKEEGKEFNIKKDKIDRLLLYNARDAAVTLEVHEAMEKELAEYSKDFNCDFVSWYHNFITQLHPFYLEIERNGLLRDKKAQAELLTKYSGMWLSRQQAFEKRLHVPDTDKFELAKDNTKIAGSMYNVSSPPDMSDLIFNKMKLPFRKGKSNRNAKYATQDDDEKQGATGEAVIASLMTGQKCDEAKKAVLQDILDIRKIRKTIGTYIKTKSDYDGRVKTAYVITGTETGRTSTRVIKGAPVRPEKMGCAFQTLTKHGELGPDIRRQYIPDEGYVFFEVDQSQAEDRVVTLLCNDINGLDEFKTLDKHWQVASWIFSDVKEEWAYKSCKDKEKPPKSDGRRFIGKKGRHGSNYDMGESECATQVNKEAQKFGLSIRISQWKAKQILDIVHERKPEIRGTYHAGIQEAINRDRTLIGPSLFQIAGGRRRQFLDRMGRDLYKEAYAFIPQCTITDHNKAAGIRLRKLVPDKRILRFIIEAHDSLTMLVLKEAVEDIAPLIKQEYERPINFKQCTLSRDYDLIIPCEMEIGHENLQQMVKYEI